MGSTEGGLAWVSILEEPPEIPQAKIPARSRRLAWLGQAPWWLISAGLHAVLLLGAALVYVERTLRIEEGTVEVLLSPRSSSELAEIERPRDVFEHKGIPKDEQNAAPIEEPAIFFPEAKLSDHNESADEEDYHQMKGESKDFLTNIYGQAGGYRGRQAGKTPGVYDTMGVGLGGGGGGRFGGRFGGRENLVARGGGAGTEDAVRAALRWLARHQSPDGSWAAAGYSAQCAGTKCPGAGQAVFDTGVTGLSLLAFLGAGYSHLSRDETPDPVRLGEKLRFGEAVKNGLKWLMAHQDPDGCVGPRKGHYMYNHAIAALALSEGYGMTQAEPLHGPAQKAIQFLAEAQNPGKGWRYSSKSGDNDTSVTGWAAMALKSADLSGLEFPKSCYEGTRAWLDDCTEGAYYKVGYTQKPAGKRDTLSMTAIGVMCRIFMDKDKKDPRLSMGCDLLLREKPLWEDRKIDFYYWYYASLALFQFDGPSGPKWKAWNEDMKNAIVRNQNAAGSGCRSGSWDPLDRWCGAGSRVYATAVNALTLEVYYRYANVFGGH